jgi:hypothetical protein
MFENSVLRGGASIEVQDFAKSRPANKSLRDVMAGVHWGDELIADALVIAFLVIMIDGLA